MKINLNNVSKFYKSETNVSVGIQNVTGEFESGEIVAIVGESGSGKSTFLNVVSLMDSFESGELLYDDIDVSGLSNDELEKERRSNVSFIFQNYNIIDSYTVLQNVMLPLTIRGYDYKEALSRAKEIINKVGLEARTHHRGTKLSGGEKQRCVIARALASDSKILACDEPTGNLDSKTGAQIMALIKEISVDRLVFIVTHNYDEIEAYATRKLKFYDGKLVEDIKIREKNSFMPKEIKDPSEGNKALGLLRIAINNIISTPKKSIFSFIITACVSFIVVLLFGLNTSMSNDSFYYNNLYYNNTDPNRVILYNKDGSNIDKEQVEEKINTSIENAYYSEISLQYSLFGKNINVFYKEYLTDEVLVIGRMPSEDNEVILGLTYATNYVNTDLSNLFAIENSSYSFMTDTLVKPKEMKVVGLYESKSSNYIIGSNKANDTIKNYMYDEIINYQTYSTSENISFDKSDNQESAIYFNTSFYEKEENRNITLNIKGLNLILNFSKINFKCYVEEDKSFSDPVVFISKNDLIDTMKNNYSSCAYYTTSIEAAKTMSKANELGLIAVWPAKSVSNIDSSLALENKLRTLLLWIATFLILFIVYLITYLVLSRVYKTKNKDYVILRTLGLSKKSSGKVVKLENVILTFLSAIFSLIIAKLLMEFIPLKFSFLKYITFGYSIIFLLLMIIFAYFLGRKFNKRIFSFSVFETLRGGILND